MAAEKRKNVFVVVLGDIGRSPRMQYHGLSFTDEGYDVTFVGYAGSQPIKPLRSNEHVKFKHMYPCPEFKNYLPTLLAYAVKVMWQVLTLLLALMTAGFPDYLLVQNPPAIPSLGVCYLYSKITRCQLVVDWHNYAYSILALSVGQDHALVNFSKRFEFFFGQRADSHLCVTKGMKEDLLTNYDIKAVTFYDRPPDFFKSTPVDEKHKLFLSLGSQYDIFIENCEVGETVFTKVAEDGRIVLKETRPGLVISSTSWTEDEDFSILLSALERYEEAKTSSDDLPDLVCAITGKGPLKEFYIKILEKRNWKHVKVITPWLEAEDYPVFLGSADLGICLHKSSSGLDLPMKVVDMFGCSVPVCAVNFKCLPELVKHEENGFIFNDEEELFNQMKDWFSGFPYPESHIQKSFKDNLEQFYKHRWHDNWKFNVKPLF